MWWKTGNHWWVSMTYYGWLGGNHVVDDYGSLVPV